MLFLGIVLFQFIAGDRDSETVVGTQNKNMNFMQNESQR